MKKVIGVLLIFMLILTACSSKETAKTKEELRAEVKAEIEAEARLKEEAKAESNVFYPENLLKGTKVSDKFVVESFNSGDMGGESISFKLKSDNFVKGELYENSGFIFARFNENIFDKKVLVADVNLDSGKTEINLNECSFMIDKSKLLLPPEYINHVQSGGTIQGNFYVKEISYDNSPLETGSNAIITEVKLNDAEVERLNKEINKELVDAMPDVYLKGFENETLYSEDNPFTIDYSKYSLVVVPMQESKNIDKLTSRVVEVTETEKQLPLSFYVFGKLFDVKLEYTKNALDSEEQPKEILIADEIENECVLVKAALPTDFSSVAITGSYQFQSGLEEIFFSLDDMRDPESYKILTVDAYSFPNEDY